ncbi:MAG: hypothetical protein ABS57_06630 [Mesorhizobium sp. SCN 65-12]|nr:MAG: hypothetical protein ABS57_06630 [Mesorhizobium sp. SCN 65-12]
MDIEGDLQTARDVGLDLGNMIRSAQLSGRFDHDAMGNKLLDLIMAPTSAPVDALAQVVHAHRLLSAVLVKYPDDKSTDATLLRFTHSLLWRAMTTLEMITNQSAESFTGNMPNVSQVVGNA